MITNDEISALRKEGMSDDEILKGYQEFDGTHKSDIDQLSKSGMKSGEILSGLADFAASRPKAEPKAETWGDTAIKGAKAVQYGAAGVASGVGKTLEAAGYTNVGPMLEKVGKAVAPSNYVPASSQFDILSPSTYGYAPRALVEGAPGLAVDLAGGAVGGAAGALAGGAGAVPGAIAGFTAAHGARSFGDNLEDRLTRDGRKLSDATAGDYAITGAATAGEGALGAVGIKGLPLGKLEAALAARGLSPALGSVTKGAGAEALSQLPGQVVAAGARDGIANAAGNVVQQTGRTIGTDKGFDINAHEAANAAGLGAVTGAGLRATTGLTRDAFQSNRMKGLMDDAESSTRVADALKGTELDLSNPAHAKDALNIVKGQLNRATKDENAKSFLKEADPETRSAVVDSLDRLRIGQTLTESQLADLNARLGQNPASAGLLRGLTDLHTLNQVKGLGTMTRAGFEGNSFQNSALNRATNPFSKFGAGAAGAIGAATQIPAAAGAVASLSPYALGAAGIAGGVQAIGRGADHLLQTRAPIDQFAQRFGGFRESEGLPAIPQAAPQADPRQDRQTDRSWDAFEKAQRQEQAAQAKREGDFDRAYAGRGEIDPELKARQEAALWKAQDAQRAAEDAPRGWETNDAKDAIKDAYAARDADSARVVDANTELRQRAQAALILRAQQEAQIRAQAGAQDAQAAKDSSTRAREYDKAEAQRNAEGQPSAADRAKAAQMAAMWKAKAEREAANAGPQGWDDAEAVQAIKAAEAQRQAESDRAVRANDIERAAANPIPVDEVVTAQPKAQTKPSISERAKAKVKEPGKAEDTPKNDEKSSKPNENASPKGEGDYFEHEGIRHPIPDDVGNRAGYIASIKRNQGKINKAVDRAYDDGQIEQKTFEAIRDRVDDLKTARNQAQARNVISEITKEAHPADRQNVMKAFDSDFLKIWSKEK